MFLEMLDDELNKVNQFYLTKESEFLERGNLLNKQLTTLLDLKRVIGDRRRRNHRSTERGNDSGFISPSGSFSRHNSEGNFFALLVLDVNFQ